MVLDKATGLIWQRCAVGQTWSGSSCTGSESRYEFNQLQSAADQANQQKLGGYSDWRVPTIRELAGLIDCHGVPTSDSDDPQDGGGAIKNLCDPDSGGLFTWNRKVFGAEKMKDPYFWSSSPYAGHSSYAWYVGFDDGNVNDGHLDGDGPIRLVRASQSSGSAAASGFVTAIAADTEGARLVADAALRAAAEAKAAAEKAAKAVAKAAADNERQAALIRMTSSGKTGQGPFVAHQSGTMVLDKSTGLIWQRCPVGQTWSGNNCTGIDQEYTLGEAKSAADRANQKNLDGYSDWRIPTVRELASLIDCHGVPTSNEGDLRDGMGVIKDNCYPGVGGPYTWNRKVFGTLESRDNEYWSSSQIPGLSGGFYNLFGVWVVRAGFWTVSYKSGVVPGGYNLNDKNAVRLVRASQLSGNEAALGFVTAIAADTEWQEEKARVAARAKAQKEEADRLQQEESRRQQAEFDRRNAAFRKSVSPGDDTSQGVVVEVKGGLVKIQTNDSQCSQRDYKGNCTNYINTPAEKWVKRSEIYPAR